MSYELAILLLSLLEQGAGLLNKLRADAAQTAEWTDEQRANFDAKLAAQQQSPAWTPEKRNEA